MDETLYRRDFMKLGFLAASGIGFIPVINGCATTKKSSSKKLEPVHYPKLPGRKLQPPEHYGLKGCYTGIVELFGPLIEYQRQFEQLPSIYLQAYSTGDFLFQFLITKKDSEDDYYAQGVIPFITFDMEGPMSNNSLKDIAKGKIDSTLKSYAKMSRLVGEEYGGLFVRSMREMNATGYFPWQGSARNFKKAWRHMHDIFSDEGANEYATWIWEIFVGHRKFVDNADFFYPGDDYVDWIGLDGFNEGNSCLRGNCINGSFYKIFNYGYSRMLRSHRKKPQMIVEMGTCINNRKALWIEETFRTIKYNMTGIKALLWFSMYWSHGNVKNCDSRINYPSEALEAYREAISDQYFLGPIPKKIRN